MLRRSRRRTSPRCRSLRRPRRCARSSEFDPNTTSTRVPVQRTAPLPRSRPSNASSASDVADHVVPMSSRLTKKSFVSVPGRVGEHTVRRVARVRPEDPQATDEGGHLGRRQREHERLVEQQVLGREVVALLEVVAEPVGRRLEHGERVDIGLVLAGVGAAGREPDLHVVSAGLGGLLHRCAPGEHDQVGERDPLAAGLCAVEILLDPFERGRRPRDTGGDVDVPLRLRRQPDARAIRTATLVGVAVRRCRRPRGRDELRHGQTCSRGSWP